MSHLTQQYPLVLWENHPILRSVSDPIALPLAPELQRFADTLLLLMHEYDGVGLAAPQIGSPIRMIATSQRKVKKDNYKHLGDTVMINPEILESSQETMITEEGCLSLPWVSWLVERAKKITVGYITVDGKKVTQDYEWFNAIIVQHEIDHLDGIMFTDKIVKEK